MTVAPSTRLGVIGSSGGSALAAAVECLQQGGQEHHWVVLTDRPCGLAEWASAHALSSRVLPYQNCESFSREAAIYFGQLGVERILLFYTRRIGEELFGAFEVSNIHPSLLPEFPGLGSVAKALAARAGLIGATLHRVDAGLDTGQIVQQVKNPINADVPLALAERISHLQKVWLTLFWIQQRDVSDGHVLASCTTAAISRYSNGLEIETPIPVLPTL